MQQATAGVQQSMFPDELGHTSVVMVSYHTGPILWLAMESVLVQPGLKELILVNNGNPPDVIDRLQHLAARDSRVKFITGQGNVGFGTGCNIGAKQATGKYVLLLNPDCLLPAEALNKTANALESTPGAWLAGCNLTDSMGKEQAGGRRHLLTPWKMLIEGFKLYKLAPNHPYFTRINLHEEEKFKEITSVPATSGAFMAIRRAHYEQLGGMDEGYFLHVEDLDFCYRVREAGGDIIFVPQVKVVHYLSTSKAPALKVERHKTDGFIRYFDKHFTRMYPRYFINAMKVGMYCRLLGKALSHRPLNIWYRLTDKSTPGHRRRRLLLNAYRNITLPDNAPKLKPGHVVMVAGATGQVGVCILRQLLRQGAEVVALRHQRTVKVKNAPLHWIDGDLDRGGEKAFALAPHRPDTYIQTAAIWMLPPHLKRLAESGVKRVICFSSTSVFSKAGSHNPYEQQLVSRFKDAEKEVMDRCAELGIACTIFRPTLIYGVGLDRNISSIAHFIERFGFFPLYRAGEGRRQPVHADDLAQAVLAVIDNPATFGKTYNLSGAETIAYHEMVERVFGLLGREPRILHADWLPTLMDLVAKVMKRPDLNGEIARRMNQDLVFPHEEATKDFGYAPRKFLDKDHPALNGNLFL